MKKSGREDKIAVCVGTITDDVRIMKIPKLRVRIGYIICVVTSRCLLLSLSGSGGIHIKML